jgi:hypothetical protein
VSIGPSLRCIKQASKADLGSPLHSGGSTLQRRKDSGSATKKISTDRNFDRMSTSILGHALPVLFSN